MKSKINYLSIVLFYSIAIICRYLSNKTDLLEGVGNEYLKAILTGLGPAVGAALVFAIFKIKPVMSLKGSYTTLLYPLAVYWLLPIALISAMAYWSNGTLPFLTVLSILLYGLLEEIGWRVFLQQELKPLPGFLRVFVIALLWFAWHLNFELSSSNLLFFLILLLGSWGIGKVADRTYSLIAVAAFHSLNNFFSELDTKKMLIIAILLFCWIGLLIARAKKNKSTPIAV